MEFCVTTLLATFWNKGTHKGTYLAYLEGFLCRYVSVLGNGGARPVR